MSDILVTELGNTVQVLYALYLEDGKLIDTNIEELSKEHAMFIAERKYEPIEFTLGAGMMIKGFDDGIVGMSKGEKKKITILPADGYGEWSEQGLIKVKKEQLPEDHHQYTIGMKLYDMEGNAFLVHKIADDEITFDTNHHLAGKNLIFDVELVEIK